MTQNLEWVSALNGIRVILPDGTTPLVYIFGLCQKINDYYTVIFGYDMIRFGSKEFVLPSKSMFLQGMHEDTIDGIHGIFDILYTDETVEKSN